MLLNCGVGEDSWEFLGLQGDPVYPKGNQSWIFIGRTDAKAEMPILWPLMWKTDSLEKILMLGKIEGRSRRGRQRMRWLDGITWLDGQAFEWGPGVGDGQGSLASCSPVVRQESDTTEWLNLLNWGHFLFVSLYSSSVKTARWEFNVVLHQSGFQTTT